MQMQKPKELPSVALPRVRQGISSISVPLTVPEREKLEELVAASGKKMAVYVRDLIFQQDQGASKRKRK